MMVYKRYIKRDGKNIGPYLYKSVRQKDGRIKSVYIGQPNQTAQKQDITLQPFLFLIALLSILLLFIIFKPLITGYFVYNTETFSKEVMLDASQSTEYEFDINNDFFLLNSLSISGSMTGEHAKVYLEIENKSYLVGEFSDPNMGLVGYAIQESSPEQAPSESPTEPQEISPSTKSAQEQPEEQSATLPSQEIQNSSTETPEAGNEISVAKESKFTNFCTETCGLNEIGIGDTKIRLRIELHNANLKITSITYSLANLSSQLNVDSEALNEIKENGKAKVIVDFKSEQGISASSETENIKVERKFLDSNAVSGEITKDDLKNLIYSHKIDKIYSDSVNMILLSESAPLINATEVWQKQENNVNITGTGETACVIDTGVSSHPALNGRIIGAHCYCSVSGPCCPNGLMEDTDATDNNGHGTHIAGIIASSDPVYRGIAPDSSIVAVKVCDASGYCSSSDMVSGVEFCVNNSELYNISVISISIGGGGYASYCDSVLPAMTSAINAARQKGILVTVASGNNGYYERLTWPSCIGNATPVMATDKNDNIASYSNRNYLVSLAGVGGSASHPIISTAPGGGFIGKDGTSMACPHVAAGILLLRQYLSFYGVSFSPEKIIQILKANGKPINDSANNKTFYRIDILDAINSIPEINQNNSSITVSGKVKIKFSSATDLADWDAFTMNNNFISLNKDLYPAYNKQAIITFYNLNYQKTPVILKDNILCADCTVFNYSNSTLVFKVEGFSTYTSSSNSELSIFDSANGTAFINKPVIFYADYASKSSGQLINGTCNLSFNQSSKLMLLNNSAYYYNTTFSDFNLYSYNVSCSSSDFEPLSALGEINITKMSAKLNLSFNNITGSINVTLNSAVIINATLLEPANESIKMYINGSFAGEGSSIANSTVFNNYGAYNITAAYTGSSDYSPYSVTSWINVITDTLPPQYSAVNGLNAVYGKNKAYQINVTWQDNFAVGSEWIEHNFFGSFSNYSMDGAYNFGDIPAGNYSLILFANDSSGNLNSTGMLNFTLNKSPNPVSIYINNNHNDLTIIYGAQSNITAVAEGNISLYRDNAQISNPEIAVLGAKSGYVYRATAAGNQNYSDNSTGASYILNVTKQEPSLTIYFNNNIGDFTFTSSTTLNIMAALSIDGNVTLYKNDGKIAEGASPLTQIESLSSNGTYKITAAYLGNDNYSAKNRTNSITIQIGQTTTREPAQNTPRISSENCHVSWTCADWSACRDDGMKERVCTDANQCGTASGKPIEIIDCNCKENLSCENWTECSDNKQTRNCIALNGCSSDKTETRACMLAAPSINGMSYSISGLNINNLKTEAISFAKKPVFYIPSAAIIIAIIAFMFIKMRGKSFLNELLSRKHRKKKK
jgi:competence protein ComGC